MNTKRTPDLDDLKPEQRARLIEFRDANGRLWKQKLNDLWLNGRDAKVRDGHLLRQVRNQHGPTWLSKLKD